MFKMSGQMALVNFVALAYGQKMLNTALGASSTILFDVLYSWLLLHSILPSPSVGFS